MRINFNRTGKERKELVAKLAELTGEKPIYLKLPTYAYKIGPFELSKTGVLSCEWWADETAKEIANQLAEAGFEGEVEAPAESSADTNTEPQEGNAEVTSMGENETAKASAAGEPKTEKSIGEAASANGETQSETEETLNEEDAEEGETEQEESKELKAEIAVPMASHTGNSLRNLVNLLYQRQALLNKATGSTFRVDKALTDRLLEENTCDTPQEFLETINAESNKLDGIEFSGDRITFTGFAETSDPATVQAYTQLTALMNKQALTQHRIVAKEVNDSNEKYVFRIWLIRIGMKGTEFKETRKILLSRLDGNCAFRTEEQLQAFSMKQKKLRQEKKAPAQAETIEPEVEANA